MGWRILAKIHALENIEIQLTALAGSLQGMTVKKPWTLVSPKFPCGSAKGSDEEASTGEAINTISWMCRPNFCRDEPLAGRTRAGAPVMCCIIVCHGLACQPTLGAEAYSLGVSWCMRVPTIESSLNAAGPHRGTRKPGVTVKDRINRVLGQCLESHIEGFESPTYTLWMPLQR